MGMQMYSSVFAKQWPIVPVEKLLEGIKKDIWSVKVLSQILN